MIEIVFQEPASAYLSELHIPWIWKKYVSLSQQDFKK